MFEITPEHEFLVGIDSDGCAFDTMEIKHKECFVPHFINSYDLQSVSRYARESWEFVNLYSKSRGTNRFPALVETLEWLNRRAEVVRRGVHAPLPQGLIQWIRSETKLGNPALQRAAQSTGNPDLAQALAWSKAVNEAIECFVRGVPPFPFVRDCLEKLRLRADLLVVSATPHEALKREWQEHDLAPLVKAICGQEIGTKKETLAAAKKYPAEHALMIGDALGDYQAAQANGALFFPINPGAEDASWRRLHDEGIERFFSGKFVGDYQQNLLAEFAGYLPEKPPWTAQA